MEKTNEVEFKESLIELIKKLAKDTYLQGVTDHKNNDVSFEDGFDYDLHIQIKLLLNDLLNNYDFQSIVGNEKYVKLPIAEDLDIRSSINAIVKIVSNDFIVFYNNKKYIVQLFISEDPREETSFNATCCYFTCDSYGETGSEFHYCQCESLATCKYAGSEFKYWDKADPDPHDTGCLIHFTDKDIDKTVFFDLSVRAVDTIEKV